MERWEIEDLLAKTNEDPTFEDDPEGWLEEHFCGKIPRDAYEALLMEVPADALMY